MDNIIDITKLSSLQENKLAIIKDTNDGVCLGIKSNSIDCSNIEFKAKNISIDNSLIYALMLKNNNNSTIYKCFISLDSINNKTTVHKLINLDRFNLIIFKDGNEQDIFRIENTDKNVLNNMLLKALISQEDSLKLSEDYINRFYTDEQLWNE